MSQDKANAHAELSLVLGKYHNNLTSACCEFCADMQCHVERKIYY
jgi:hypothetical protein